MISTVDSKYSKDLVCKKALDAWNKIKGKPKHEIENTIEYLIANAASTTKYLNLVKYFNTETSNQNRIIEKVIVPGTPPPNTVAQKKAKKIIIKINDEITKYQEDYNSTIYLEAKYELMDCIQDLKNRKKRPKFKEALASHKVTTVLRNEKAEHQNNHYCLASVKVVRQFASLFLIFSVIMSQDDKAKVPLGISAVSRTFQAIQSINEPVIVPDHDFPVVLQQKLVPSVYLIIDSSDTNNMLRSGQLSIYIRPQYEIETSSITHMNDLYSLMNNGHFDNMLKVDNKIRPIWVLLVDGGLDKNL
ncbi:7007_t:CDS:2 [Cetraspora pellucida]|uniref:7007_t:CDS:1 n=1 Tax=Cetraspora pellucida TaxID=1433469 RepID=A0A9N9J7E1_9GLOM|nr:7007_t:CDS:2 [Cetraspora pellucida]